MFTSEQISANKRIPFSIKYAMHVIAQHGADQAEFVDTFGFYETYSAKAVLEWLGY